MNTDALEGNPYVVPGLQAPTAPRTARFRISERILDNNAMQEIHQHQMAIGKTDQDLEMQPVDPYVLQQTMMSERNMSLGRLLTAFSPAIVPGTIHFFN